MLTDQMLDQITGAVARGEITQEEARKLVRDTVFEAAELARQTSLAETRLAANVGPSSTDIQLAVAGLQRSGLTRERAFEKVAAEGIGPHAELIRQEAEREVEAARAEAARIYENSPEGRRAAATAAMAAAEAQERDGRLAKAWLKEQNLVSDDDLSSISDREAIALAFEDDQAAAAQKDREAEAEYLRREWAEGGDGS